MFLLNLLFSLSRFGIVSSGIACFSLLPVSVCLDSTLRRRLFVLPFGKSPHCPWSTHSFSAATNLETSRKKGHLRNACDLISPCVSGRNPQSWHAADSASTDVGLSYCPIPVAPTSRAAAVTKHLLRFSALAPSLLHFLHLWSSYSLFSLPSWLSFPLQDSIHSSVRVFFSPQLREG